MRGSHSLWYLNIPVLSWLALRENPPRCGTRISFRYCFVESLTALLFAALGWKYADASAEAAVFALPVDCHGHRHHVH
ncbi:MAG: prepilin peptidase [Akkermansia sp.]